MTEYHPEEAWALEQDRADPLAWSRDEFALPTGGGTEPLVYFSGNSLGLMPKAARTEVTQELDDWARLGVDAHFDGVHPWYSASEELREPLARLVGARLGEVVAMNSLTVNLHLMLISFYHPNGKRRKILMEEAAFPSDAYAVATHLAARGIEAEALLLTSPRPGERLLRGDDLETLLAERGSEIALVWLGAVHYYTGRLFELERITRAAKRAGCVVGFDLAHAAGNVPLGLHEWGVDFAVWCSYKYLNAGPGAVGGCYVHERHGGDPALRRFAGWWGNDPATRFEMQSHPEFVPVPGVAGWQVSNPPILAMAPLRASLALFEKAGLPALRAKSERLTGYLEFLAGRLAQGGVAQLTPGDSRMPAFAAGARQGETCGAGAPGARHRHGLPGAGCHSSRPGPAVQHLS